MCWLVQKRSNNVSTSTLEASRDMSWENIARAKVKEGKKEKKEKRAWYLLLRGNLSYIDIFRNGKINN